MGPRRRACWPVVWLGLSLAGASAGAAPPYGLRVPAGFEVLEVAGSGLADDIFCMTLDPAGRPAVSGRGYLRVLVDDDGDGRADRALDFRHPPADGAQGLLWEGDTLYCMGGGGLYRYDDAGGDGRLRKPQRLAHFRTGGEHDAHALGRGPDGWFYVLCGNATGIGPRHASLPTSPVREPLAGCVLRFAPDFTGSEIVADGFRNAYGMDWNPDGELFTFDSDNERCVSLPWYEPTRCYHVVPGGHYGWRSPQRSQTWRLPPYFPDVVAPVATLGRGSPTGIVCYRHIQFPEKYHGALFLLDWTFGRVWAVRLEQSGSTYVGRAELFLESVGDNGFAPTAAAVDPATGDLYLSIGGRGTRGAVYRVRYAAGLAAARAAGAACTRLRPRPPDWVPGSQESLLTGAAESDLHERRRALEAILRHREHFTGGRLAAAVRANAGHPDRLLRQSAAALFAALPVAEQGRLSRAPGCAREAVTLALARHAVDVAPLVADRSLPADVRLGAVRALQLALGDLTVASAQGTAWEGYTPHKQDATLPARVLAALRGAFPSGDADLDRELSRTLAMVEDDDPGVLARTAALLTADSQPVEDVHYLIVLARLRGPRPAAVTRRVADGLLGLDRKLERLRLHRDRNWPLRVAELHAGLAARDGALNAALLARPEFGRPGHALLARCPGFDRRRAAEVFLARAQKDEELSPDAELVGLLGELPPGRVAGLLRRWWGEAGLDDVIVPLLAREPRAEDRPRFRAALSSPQPAVAAAALAALERLPPAGGDADEVLGLLLALRRLPPGKEGEALRSRLEAALRRDTGQPFSGADAWEKWYAGRYPDRAGRLADADGVDVTGWRKRLAAIDWPAGDAGRGRAVFTKAGCAACHGTAQALGPDLRGVAGRFSRDDLFTAILQPSKDVSPRYRTTQVFTESGKVYQGLVVYESADGLLLQTGPAATVRLAASEVRGRRPAATSLMPAGLLDRLGDRDVADLYAYLKSQ
jgi:putative heme-binding domain-containing protein